VIGVKEFTADILRLRVDHITVQNGNVLIYHFKDGAETTRTWKDRSRSESWTPERREAARRKQLEQKEN
jgi:hypothetical protein